MYELVADLVDVNKIGMKEGGYESKVSSHETRLRVEYTLRGFGLYRRGSSEGALPGDGLSGVRSVRTALGRANSNHRAVWRVSVLSVLLVPGHAHPAALPPRVADDQLLHPLAEVA